MGKLFVLSKVGRGLIMDATDSVSCIGMGSYTALKGIFFLRKELMDRVLKDKCNIFNEVVLIKIASVNSFLCSKIKISIKN